MATKGISPVVATLLTLVVIIVVFLIFFTFQRNAFFQQEALFSKGTEATGEAPCVRAPSLEVDSVTLTNLNKTEHADLMTDSIYKIANLTPTIKSNCMENLTITWDFGDKSPPIETECAYNLKHSMYGTFNNSTGIFSSDNCSTAAHPYLLRGTSDIWAAWPVKITVLGMRSGFYTEDTTTAFITDPAFEILSLTNDSSDFTCVKLTAKLNYSSTKPNPHFDFKVVDDGSQKDVDRVTPTSDPTVFDIFYRADELLMEHSVSLVATAQSSQDTPKATNKYSSNHIANKPEIVLVSSGLLSIFNSAGIDVSAALGFNGSNFPSSIQVKDMALGDLDSDGIADFAFVAEPGDLFALSYSSLKNRMTPAYKIMPLDKVAQHWPWNNLPDDDGASNPTDYDWTAVAIGKNIGGNGGNILALAILGRLNLYKYESGTIYGPETVTPGTGSGWRLQDDDGESLNGWKDVAAYDVNNDGEDEVVLLRGSNAGDLYVFKYGKLIEEGDDEIDLNSVDWAWRYDLPGTSWTAVTVANFQHPKEDHSPEIFAMAQDHLIMFESWADSGFFIGAPQEIRNWPTDIQWLDMASGDVDGDGLDELIFLEKEYDSYFVDIIDNPTRFIQDGFSWSDTSIKSMGTTARTRLAAGDFVCS